MPHGVKTLVFLLAGLLLAVARAQDYYDEYLEPQVMTRTILDTFQHSQPWKIISLPLFVAYVEVALKWYLRWRAMMLIREPGTAGSTVGWESGLGTVSQYIFHLSSSCIFSF